MAKEKDDGMDRIFHFIENLVFPGIFWYVVFFAGFKSTGTLNISWRYIAVPFALLPLLMVLSFMLGIYKANARVYRENQRSIDAQAALNDAIFHKVEEAKREIEAKEKEALSSFVKKPTHPWPSSRTEN